MPTENQMTQNTSLFNILSFSKPNKHKIKDHPGVSSFLNLGLPLTNFMRNLNTIIEATPPSATQLANAIAAFGTGGTLISNYADFEITHEKLLKSMIEIKLLREITRDSVLEIFHRHYGSSIPDSLSTQNKQTRASIWDSVVYYSHTKSNEKLKSLLIDVLKGYAMLDMVRGDERPDFHFELASKCILVLPPNILRMKAKIKTQVSLEDIGGGSEEPNIDYSEIEREIDLARKTIMSLRSVLLKINTENQIASSKFVPEYDSDENVTNMDEYPTLKQTLYIDNAIYNSLTTEEKEFLANKISYNGSDDVYYDTIEQELNKIISNNTAQLFKTAQATNNILVEWGIPINIGDINGLDEPVANPGPVIGPPDIDPIPLDYDPCKYKTFGVADYRRVEQDWESYEPAEIAHIENMLAGETKERDTRHLRRKEESYTIETIKEEEALRDVQTTERFAMQNETQTVIEKDLAGYIDAKVSGAAYAVNAGVSFSVSSSESKNSAEQYAKEVINRATSRIMQRYREERTVKVLEEFEDINKHSINNAVDVGGLAIPDNLVGIYRWINKKIQYKLVNYGRRLILQFNVPEPAAFQLHTKTNISQTAVNMVEQPIDPVNEGILINGVQKFLKSANDLDANNYQQWAGLYKADIAPIPDEFVYVNKTCSQTADGNSSNWAAYSDNTMALPEGYFANQLDYYFHQRNSNDANITIEDCNFWINTTDVAGWNITMKNTNKSTVGISVMTKSNDWTMKVHIKCKICPETYAKWQLDTFIKILSAYKKLLQEAESKIEELKTSQTFELSNSNPLELREIEMNELKKGCIQILNENYVEATTGYNTFYEIFNAMRYKNPDLNNLWSFYPHNPNPLINQFGYPEFINCGTIQEGKVIHFFENAFDWKLISYKFNPYFYAQKKRWMYLNQLHHDDLLFSNFLKAGSATVLVPVKPGYEKMVATFIESGYISEGLDSVYSIEEAIDALIDVTLNPLYDYDGDGSIFEADGITPDAGDVPPTWSSVVPTNLVMLQKADTGIATQGLPTNPNL